MSHVVFVTRCCRDEPFRPKYSYAESLFTTLRNKSANYDTLIVLKKTNTWRFSNWKLSNWEREREREILNLSKIKAIGVKSTEDFSLEQWNFIKISDRAKIFVLEIADKTCERKCWI